MITDLRKVYEQVREANLRQRNGKRPFKKDYHVVLHYSYYFFLVHQLIKPKDDDLDRTKAFSLFCELCSLDLKRDLKSYEQFEKSLIIK